LDKDDNDPLKPDPDFNIKPKVLSAQREALPGPLKPPPHQMVVIYISNGRIERIPPIGHRMEIKPHIFFEVKGYGNSLEYEDPLGKSPTGKIFKIELYGTIIIPKGSPVEIIEDLLKKGIDIP